MSDPVPSIESALRSLRIIYGVMLFSMFLYFVAAERLGARVPHDVHIFQLGNMTISFLLVVFAFMVRLKRVQSAAEILQTQPNDSVAMGRWRSGTIISFVLAEAVMLFGFVVRFMGGTILQAAPFYAVAIVLMLLWWPRRP